MQQDLQFHLRVIQALVAILTLGLISSGISPNLLLNISTPPRSSHLSSTNKPTKHSNIILLNTHQPPTSTGPIRLPHLHKHINTPPRPPLHDLRTPLLPPHYHPLHITSNRIPHYHLLVRRLGLQRRLPRPPVRMCRDGMPQRACRRRLRRARVAAVVRHIVLPRAASAGGAETCRLRGSSGRCGRVWVS